MTGLVANVLLNILLVALLMATIGYCYVLNRRIRILQDSRSELATLLKQFDDSTVKASETIVAMQTASKKIGDNIQLRIDKANYLLDDLSYAIEKASRLTSQIEASFAVNRARDKVIHEKPPILDHDLHPTDGETEKTADKHGHKTSGAKRSPATIEAILEKVVSRKQQTNEQVEATKEAPTPRSRAEQELIELIRSSKG